MAEQQAPQMQATLGLTGLTSNAMALIAPGVFLGLIFGIQATIGSMAPDFGLSATKEPQLALGISGLWGIYGAIYFIRSSKALGKPILLRSK
jgi:hypothetical protein